jgi:hypothetical protein
MSIINLIFLGMSGVICAELFMLLKDSSSCYDGLWRVDRGIKEIEVVAVV